MSRPEPPGDRRIAIRLGFSQLLDTVKAPEARYHIRQAWQHEIAHRELNDDG